MARTKPTTEILKNENGLIAADTFREEEIDTPVDINSRLAMLITKIIFGDDGFSGIVVADGDTIVQSLTDKSQTVVRDMDHEAHIADYQKTIDIGALFFNINERGLRVWKFDPPLLYAKTKMYHQFDTGGIGATLQARTNIHYTLEKVSQQVFIDALTE